MTSAVTTHRCSHLVPSEHVQPEQEVHILRLQHRDAAVEEGRADLRRAEGRGQRVQGSGFRGGKGTHSSSSSSSGL